MSLGAECCVFGIDRNKKVLEMGCGGELVWAARAQGSLSGDRGAAATPQTACG